MLLAEVVSTSAAVAATRSRRRKVELLAGTLARLDDTELAVGAPLLAGATRQERLDVGWAARRSLEPPPARAPALTVLEVDRALDAVAGVRGPGSRAVRRDILLALLGAATGDEQQFLRGLVLGDLRQGALAAVLAQAIASAAGVPEDEVRRALMLQADLGAVAVAARSGGREALAAFRLTLFRPLQPMLAQTAASVADALRDMGRAAIDLKLDGARVQVHRAANDVRVYTRNLRDVTARSQEVVAAVASLDVGSVVLDGEVLALRRDGRPYPFQDTMRRFGTEPDVAGLPPGLALTPFFFDCLHLDGEDLLDRPLVERTAALARAVPAEHRVGRSVVADVGAGEALLADALRAGHEGVMVKALDAPYEAGRRGAAWRKVKVASTLDLVVLAAEWGSGRRRGWLSNLHLGARDPETGGFVMLGKTFKGLTDQVLEWQTHRLLELETARDGHVVSVRPQLVVEIAFDGVQASSRYPGGVTLRFARVKRYRDDKDAAQADTIDLVRAIHAGAPGPTDP